MNRLFQESIVRRTTMAAASAVLAIVTVMAPVRADHVEYGLGVLLGGIVGGTIGSTIGDGSGRRVAIGVGSALGALYGGDLARHDQRRHYRRHTHHVHPRHAHIAPAVTYHPPAVPVYVQPAPVYVTPPVRTVETSNYASVSTHGSTTARRAPEGFTECRLLEGGLAPVYGCRDAYGEWRILR